jgi:hypothetical protein
MTATRTDPSAASARLVSPSCDPTEFVRAAVAWDRARLAAEAQRELRTASLLCERSLIERTPTPPGCRSYVNFLARLEEWLGTGNVPRYPRRELRQLLLTIAEALVKRGQMDPMELAELHPRSSPRR